MVALYNKNFFEVTHLKMHLRSCALGSATATGSVRGGSEPGRTYDLDSNIPNIIS